MGKNNEITQLGRNSEAETYYVRAEKGYYHNQFAYVRHVWPADKLLNEYIGEDEASDAYIVSNEYY
ncbi:hypothetical protein CW304_24845 [Bacillus sp. UFRGS-B20]|nr:hypothetical protein CW304_24845 [Bacillus sp. UFRGS-B20]